MLNPRKTLQQRAKTVNDPFISLQMVNLIDPYRNNRC